MERHTLNMSEASIDLIDIVGYRVIEIDPLLDELERLKADNKPLPSLDEFVRWLYKKNHIARAEDIYTYFDKLQFGKITVLNKLESIRTWIIENAEDVTGQDGVKWNAIDRDEILNYLKAQDDDI